MDEAIIDMKEGRRFVVTINDFDLLQNYNILIINKSHGGYVVVKFLMIISLFHIF